MYLLCEIPFILSTKIMLFRLENNRSELLFIFQAFINNFVYL